jgi:hypothetical protein
MSSLPNQYAVFTAKVAFVVILVGVATFSILAFWSLGSIIMVTSHSLPVAWKLVLGILLIAVSFGLLVSHNSTLHVLARRLDVRLDANCT